MSSDHHKIAIIGAGTIGLSFAALHLAKDPHSSVTIFDTRPDFHEYVQKHLPGYLIGSDEQACLSRLTIVNKIEDAVANATIVQEQGPENPDFKTSIWPQIESHAPATALLWSSTSGIPASIQNQKMHDPTRLLVVHPYNPPHIMPLLECVPSPQTSQDVIDRTLSYWRSLGRTPVHIKKECTGFVSNRLAFALFREACSLVSQGVISVKDLDDVVTNSMGPRWAVNGPFKSYHAGGGEGGLKSFMEKLGGTVQGCWDASEKDVKEGSINVGSTWQADVCRQADESYGVVDVGKTARKTKKVLEAVQE